MDPGLVVEPRRQDRGDLFRYWQARHVAVERQATSRIGLWQAYSHKPDFEPFKDLKLRPDGGLKFIKTAQHGGCWPVWPKYIKVVFGYVILLVNVGILLRCARVARQEISAHRIWSQSGEVPQEVPQLPQQWPHEVRRRVNFRQLQVGFMPLVWRQALVSVYEIGGLVYYCARLLVAVWRARRTHGGKWVDDYNSWEATVDIYWDIIPSVRTFSALRTLKHVHPQLFIGEIRSAHFLYRMRLGSRRKVSLMMSLFVLKRVVILCFGLQAFIYKFTQTAAQLEMNEGRPLAQILLGTIFLNQLVGGVVQMDIQFRNRLMLFLFGGEDARIEPEEDALMHVWFAHAAYALWQRAFGLDDDAASELGGTSSLSCRRPSFRCSVAKERRLTASERLLCWIRWVVAISDFNHIDLQKAVLWEGSDHRKRRSEILDSRGIDLNAVSLLD